MSSAAPAASPDSASPSAAFLSLLASLTRSEPITFLLNHRMMWNPS